MQAPVQQHWYVHTVLVVLDVNYNSTTFVEIFKI